MYIRQHFQDAEKCDSITPEVLLENQDGMQVFSDWYTPRIIPFAPAPALARPPPQDGGGGQKKIYLKGKDIIMGTFGSCWVFNSPILSKWLQHRDFLGDLAISGDLEE